LLIVPQWDSYEAMKHQQQGAPPHFAFLFVHCSTDVLLVGGLVVEDQQKGIWVIYFFLWRGGGERWVEPNRKSTDKNQEPLLNWNNKLEMFTPPLLFTS